MKTQKSKIVYKYNKTINDWNGQFYKHSFQVFKKIYDGSSNNHQLLFTFALQSERCKVEQPYGLLLEGVSIYGLEHSLPLLNKLVKKNKKGYNDFDLKYNNNLKSLLKYFSKNKIKRARGEELKELKNYWG